ncbi:MAG: glycosyltransferase family 2 protein [Clostridia bacterium]|jgi:cellulose synthase/poly-beta-1,6-N-acetylglucosamine synthase-like glycosyltransferase|nr:glycosyltransferase family 2 protein [Clostridia bacterium]
MKLKKPGIEARKVGGSMIEIICSIVIATRNEEDFIGSCLETLENQEFNRAKYEIIIIDGLSEDSTINIITEKQKIYSNIVLLSNPKKIAASAFNIGIKNSRGNYVFILGAHAEYPSDFIKKSLDSFEENHADCIGGRETEKSKSKLGEVFAAVRNTAFGGGLSPYRYSDKKQYVKTVAFGCYKKEALERVGGFDEDLIRNQDNDLNKRILQSGGKILFDPEIRFYYFSRDSLKGIFRQLFGYGYWEAKLIKRRKSQFSIVTLIPSIFVIYTLFAILFLVFCGSAFPLCLEFIPYLIIFAYFAIRVIMPNRLNPMIALFLYLLIHFSIGLGFIVGLIYKKEG